MKVVVLCAYLFYFIFQAPCLSRALECQDPSTVAYTITVSKSGAGNFTTIADAVNSIPDGNNRWIKIALTPATYTEQIEISSKKSCIIIEGQDRATTTITYNLHPTKFPNVNFAVYADNFIAKGITFQNTYNSSPAIAFGASGDKHAFYSCGFKGHQDTLLDQLGRHYFKSCYIEGMIDFIFGAGQSVYENCDIKVMGDGSITAQGRENPSDTNGFVFRECNVSGTGHSVLGRPWRAFARVIFTDSIFLDVIRPEGWNIWNQTGHELDITFAEDNCMGPGADTSQRVPWLKHLSSPDLNQYTTQSFINQDGWIDKLPIH